MGTHVVIVVINVSVFYKVGVMLLLQFGILLLLLTFNRKHFLLTLKTLSTGFLPLLFSFLQV